MKLFKIVLGLSFISLTAHSAEKQCRLVVDPASVKVNWTAYKTSEKVPVSGSIKGFEVTTPVKGAKSLKAVLAQTKVNGFIDNASKSDSGNPGRDATLFEKFFKLILSQAKYRGAFNHIKGDDQAGEMNLQLSLEGKVKELPMKYAFSPAGVFEATGEMDLNQFGLEKALASLNDACKEQHKGKDGVSKTWPNVGLKLTAKVIKDCGGKK